MVMGSVYKRFHQTSQARPRGTRELHGATIVAHLQRTDFASTDPNPGTLLAAETGWRSRQVPMCKLGRSRRDARPNPAPLGK